MIALKQCDTIAVDCAKKKNLPSDPKTIGIYPKTNNRMIVRLGSLTRSIRFVPHSSKATTGSTADRIRYSGIMQVPPQKSSVQGQSQSVRGITSQA